MSAESRSFTHPVDVRNVYLDNNASTIIDSRVLELVIKDLAESMGNPSSIHSSGQRARQKLAKARQTIATALGVKAQEIVFTSGGTEGANYILRGFFEGKESGHIVSSDIEHSCVFSTVKFLESKGCTATFLAPAPSGEITPEAVRAALRPNTRIIALMAANNETGVRLDLQAIAAIAKEANVFFFVDGVALLGKETFSIPKEVSAIFFSGHKIHAPKGVGFAVIRSRLPLQPLLIGGEQEFGRRAGTENLSGIVGLAEAVRLLNEELPEAAEKMRALRDYFENQLITQLAEVSINGSGSRVSNTSSICFAGVEGETLLAALDLAGIAASHGSACSSGALEPSRVLLNMGLSHAAAGSSLRFSLSRLTTQEEIDHCIAVLLDLVPRLRRNG